MKLMWHKTALLIKTLQKEQPCLQIIVWSSILTSKVPIYRMSKKQSIFVNVYLGVDQFVESQEVDRKYGGWSLCQQ